ncbi:MULTISPECIES: transcriptional regulator [Vibrio]|uniref:transcriptional regulator n=1 Tax=Vibrio TaxID=662 RepID=UPI00352C3BA0
MSVKDNLYTAELCRAEKRAFAREELVFNVTEDLLVIMEDMGISKTELARKLGKSKSYITQVLSGSRNMTLGSFSDICFALDFKPEIKLPVEEQKHYTEYEDLAFVSKKAKTRHLKVVSSSTTARKLDTKQSWANINYLEVC